MQPASRDQAPNALDLGAQLAELADADLLALRLAAQVLGHKGRLLDRPLVARWFDDLGRLVDFQLARKGVGFVVGAPPALALDPDAEAADRRLLAEHLALLSDNLQLPPPVRAVCGALRAEIAD